MAHYCGLQLSELAASRFVVKDGSGQKVAYIYYEDETCPALGGQAQICPSNARMTTITNMSPRPPPG